MRRILSILSFALLLLLAPATAQDWARKRVEDSPRHLEWRKIQVAGREVNTYVAYPERPDKAPVVVLIHEIFGHTDWVRLMADHLAEAGYIVVAPDLLSGMAPNGGGSDGFPSQEVARKAVGELDPDQVTSDLKAAVEFAKQIPAANGDVVVAGFCWGGTQSFRFATNTDQIDAALVFYGTAPQDEEELKRIQAPVYGFYAENDARVSSTIDSTKQAMDKLDKAYFPVVYQGAGHGFMRAGEDPGGNEGNRSARPHAWQRTLELLKLIEVE